MKKIAQIATAMALGLGMACFSYPTDGHAASYESMKDHLLNGTGTLYNGRLQRNLTQAEGEAYVAIMDQLIAENGGERTIDMPQIAENQIADQAAAQGEEVLPAVSVAPVEATSDTEEAATVASETPVVAEPATEATDPTSEATTTEENLAEKIIGAITYPFEVLGNFFSNLF